MQASRISCGAIALAMLAGSTAAHAQQGQISTYAVSHDVVFDDPNADTARVYAYDFKHVWLNGQGQQAEDHLPFMQDQMFDAYGTESPGPNHTVRNSGHAFPVPVLYTVGQIQPTGSVGGLGCLYIDLPQGSRAEACNSISVDPWVNQAPLHIEGRIESSGYADARVTGRGGARAYAYSAAAIRIDSGITQSGRVNWTFQAHVDSVGDGATDSAIQDPVRLTATNTVNGDVRVFDIVAIDTTHAGRGQVDVSAGNLHVDIPEFTLAISIDPAVIDPTQAGELRLEVVGGVIQTAIGTGVYAGGVPPIGLGIPFDMPMPAIVLDYDLGLSPADGWTFAADLGGSGGGQSVLDGCPADLAEPLGVLDLADINAFITGFVEMLPQADLSGDGVWDLEDIGLFIESFIAGCP